MKISEQEIDKLITNYRLEMSETGFSRLPQERESRILSYIREGDYKAILELGGMGEIKEHLGRLAGDPKKNLEYYTVSAIALSLRSAIEGGMEPEEAYDLSDVLLQKLSRSASAEDIEYMFLFSAATFAKGVYYARKSSNIYAVEKAKVYISRNIFKKIRIEDVALFVGLSKEHMERIFSRHQGITMLHYIQREKIEVACNMLKYSDKTIAEISLYMGFQSQSNFGKVFRKWKNMTPSEYQNRYRRDNYTL